MSKRKRDALDGVEDEIVQRARRPEDNRKKHSLDSDEEDDDEDEKNNVMPEEDIEGEEEGTDEQFNEGNVPLTAFNMREELEEGHFDRQGNFIWTEEKEIRDEWLDNINWSHVKKATKAAGGAVIKGLGEESDSGGEEEQFDEIKVYKELLSHMQPNETVNKAIRRLGGSKKLSSAERLKRKKEGKLETDPKLEKVTELANKILTQMGNMDVYQETYEQIKAKIDKYESKNKSKKNVELDMYSDDFSSKEKEKLEDAGTSNDEKKDEKKEVLMWEFKWSENAQDIQGPFSSEQMLNWVNEGYFEKGVLVRKIGESTNFYSSNRIDFDLYI